jgi:flagellar P-ring protein FlgI
MKHIFKLLIVTFILQTTTAFASSNLLFQEYEDSMKNIREKPAPGMQIKIQNLANIEGEEDIKLSGFGIVSGLNGTGDSGDAAIKMLLNVADKQGLRLTEDDISKSNLALVTISAVVNPHADAFDVAVKSVSDSDSLQNGFLEPSTLSPIGSSEVFAVCSGSIALGARYFSADAAEGATGGEASQTSGHPTVGFVLNGGELVKDFPSQRLFNQELTLLLKFPNYRTSTNIANVINYYMEAIGLQAQPTSASKITIKVPAFYENNEGELTRLIADINDLSTSTDRKAIITIDQGSGAIAMTEGVKMEPGSIAIAGLTVTVSSDITPVTRQGVYSGETDFIDSPMLDVSEQQASFLTVQPGTDLRKVQETLNALNLTPTSIISIFTAMHKAGMIHADIRVIPR